MAQAAGTSGQRASQVGCDLAAQGGDGMRIMPFRSNRQRHEVSPRVAGGVGEVGGWRPAAVGSRAWGKKGIVPPPGSRRQQCRSWHGGESRASSVLRSAQSKLLLQFLVVALDAPTQL